MGCYELKTTSDMPGPEAFRNSRILISFRMKSIRK
jgi:hypothetical protein